MTFSDALSSVFSKYADFSGRARRSEFWYWQLFRLMVGVFTFFLDLGLETEGLPPIAGVIVGLGLLLPDLSVTARRLHDIGRSGWWMLLWIIPIVGWIIMLVWHCKDSEAGPNAYGQRPHDDFSSVVPAE